MSFDNKDFVNERYGKAMAKTDLHTARLSINRSWLPEAGRLLEIGTWDGSTVRYYKETFKGNIYGLDISLDVMREAMDVLDEAKTCDLNNLSSDPIPWENDFFDTVVCSEIIEHVFDTEQLLKEIHRILKPGGLLIISTPNLSSFINKIFILFGLQPLATEVSTTDSRLGNPFRQSVMPSGHIRNFTARAFEDIVRKNGFNIEAKAGAAITNKTGIRFIEELTGKLNYRWASDVCLKARKA